MDCHTRGARAEREGGREREETEETEKREKREDEDSSSVFATGEGSVGMAWAVGL
jgi:hypothetical protein